MAYGTPRHPGEIEAYYTDIRRGRPPTPEALAELTARYAAIGGVSPLAALTAAQGDAIQAALDERAPATFDVVLGDEAHRSAVEAAARDRRPRPGPKWWSGWCSLRTTRPPRSATTSLAADGHRRADPRGIGVELRGIESWATEPALVAFLAHDLGPRIAAMRAATGRACGCCSRPIRSRSASSTPAIRTPTNSEPRRRPWPIASAWSDWSIAWQSAGRTPEPWIGPDILQVIDELGASGEYGGVIVCACGFVADHLEVLYDLDIEAAHRADAAGLAFDRTASVNADPDVMAALADRVIEVARSR